MAKEFSLAAATALLSVLGWASTNWADQPDLQPTASAAIAPANTPTAPETPVHAGHVSLRDRLFHWPLFTHAKAPCPGCSPANDPDMGCGTCHSEWVFLFGSCRAFYNEPYYYDPWWRR
jgi:hypothetical protein